MDAGGALGGSWRPSLLSDDRGSHLLEVAVGALVMAVAVTGVMATMGSGLQMVGHSRQRSSGVALAQERVERIRKLPYETVALTADSPAPTHNPDPSHPDHNVIDGATEQPPRYRIAGSGAAEPLVISEDGAISHVDEPASAGGVSYSVYQYVTWVDDAGFSVDKEPLLEGDQDYKRVTVIATWGGSDAGAATDSVVESTFVADTAIAAPESTSPPAGTGTPPPPPSPTPGTGCPGDTVAPSGSMTVLSGTGAADGYTNSTSVQLRGSVVDTCSQVYAQLSNDGTNFTGVATLVNSQPVTVAWKIPPGDGAKTIYGRLRDANGNTSQVASQTVFLDQSAPAKVANLRIVTCELGTKDRTISFTWDAATDSPGGSPPTLLGYRLYRSVDAQPFLPLGTASKASFTDTYRKSDGSVRYSVRAYDRAGNESADSNVLFFAGGRC